MISDGEPPRGTSDEQEVHHTSQTLREGPFGPGVESKSSFRILCANTSFLLDSNYKIYFFST